MKINNLVVVFFLAILGFASCTQDDSMNLESERLIAQEELGLELRGPKKGEPNNCCSYEWHIISKDNDGECCVYEISVNNKANCSLTILNMGTVNANSIKKFLVPVCGETNVTFNVNSNNDFTQTTTLCGVISLSPDCSTEKPCENDCVINLVSEDLGTHAQFTESFYIVEGCDDKQTGTYLEQFIYLYKNDSDCSDNEVLDIWNDSHPNNTRWPVSLSNYTSLIQEVIQERKGCQDAQVSVVQNNQGGIEYEISYDCATCEIVFIQATDRGFNVSDDCTERVLPEAANSVGGFTNCGACD